MARDTDGAESAAGRAPPADEYEGDAPPIGAPIVTLTRWLALAGGALLLAAVAITLVSVAGRYALNMPVTGDYELVETIAAVGIFFFFPYTHATNSNIVVRFFTDGMAPRGKRLLDLAHDAIFTAIAALLAWRLAIGLADKFHTGESTMLVRIPYWWAYGFAVFALFLLCIVCLARLLAAARALRQ